MNKHRRPPHKVDRTSIMGVINDLITENQRLAVENGQLRMALSSQPINCTFADMVLDIQARNHEIGQVLEKAEAIVFKMGRLDLVFRGLNEDEKIVLSWKFREYMETYTSARFGKSFTISSQILSDEFLTENSEID